MNILITGGASGLGKAIVQNLAYDESRLIYFTYSNSRESAENLQQQFQNVRAMHCDFGQNSSVEELLKKIPELKIDALVNNAYTGLFKKYFHAVEHAQFETSFRLNVIPTLRITQEVVKNCRTRKFGKILNVITSFVLNKPPIGLSDYVACKAYLLSMSKSWAVENAKFNITSNCISPAFMLTSIDKDVDERIVETMEAAHPLKKILGVEEVAEAVSFYLKSSQQLNGTNMVINAAADIA